jgi:hypothetical protein
MTTTCTHPRGSEFYRGMPDPQFHVRITAQALRAQVPVLVDCAESGGQELGRGDISRGGPILRTPFRSHCALASWRTRTDLDKQSTGPAHPPSAAAPCIPLLVLDVFTEAPCLLIHSSRTFHSVALYSLRSIRILEAWIGFE